MMGMLFLVGFPYVHPLYYEQIPLGNNLMISSRLGSSTIEGAIYNQVVLDWNYQVFYDYPYALYMDFYAPDCDTTPGNICLTDIQDDPASICDEYPQYADDPLLGQTCYRRKRIVGFFPTNKIEWAVIYMPYYDSTHISWNASPDSGRWHGPTVVRHEIAHAIGLGHDRDDTGSLLMKPVLPPGEARPLDSVVRDAVYCKYGPPDTYTPPAAGQVGLRVLNTKREEITGEKEWVACPIFQIGGCGYVPPSNCDMDSVVLEIRDEGDNVVYTYSTDPSGCTVQVQWVNTGKMGRYRVTATAWFGGQAVATAPLWIQVYPSRTCLLEKGSVVVQGSEENVSEEPVRVVMFPGEVRVEGFSRALRVGPHPGKMVLEVWDPGGRRVA